MNVIAILFLASLAHAQDMPQLPDVPEVQLETSGGSILALEQGQRAPRAGMLIADEDLAAWRLEIRRLRFQLDAQRNVFQLTMEARLEQERARTRAAEDRLELRDRLWGQRAQELSDQLAVSRADEGPAWYEHPVLWFAAGVACSVAIVVAVSSSR
jgi:hypothetical protein